MIYDVRTYGAIADGKTLCTKAIQAAIDDCYAAGGGQVMLEGGVFVSGTIILRSFVDFHIEANATLLASPNCDDFPERSDVRHVDSAMLPRCRNACFIFAEESRNFSITGLGTIDCNGSAFVKPVENYEGGWMYERIDALTPPRAVFLTGCRFVRIEDVSMINQPAGWSYWIHDCDFVTCDKLKLISNVHYPNSDGIHINCSRDITVSNCNIITGDDAIIVRANNSSLPENKVCERVTVTNCTITSYADGIRIGWLNDGVIRNCTFSNIVMTETNTGIVIQLPSHKEGIRWPDEGREDTLIENLSFSNIVMDQIYASPIRILINVKCVRCKAVRRIFFDNIHARGLEYPHFKGRPDCLITDVVFSNCSFERMTDEEMPQYRHHGSADWDRPLNNKMFEFVDNITVNNTTFSSKQ